MCKKCLEKVKKVPNMICLHFVRVLDHIYIFQEIFGKKSGKESGKKSGKIP